jgi:DNA polymerase-3 subunit epsilon
MRAVEDGGGCFPTGRHYPGIAHLLRIVAQGLIDEIDAQHPISAMPFVSIDTETTGRDPAVDRVVEIALVVWESGDVVARHRWLVNPGRSIAQEAIDVHGITDEAVKDAPPFAAIAHEVLAVLEGKIPVAYNAEFDRLFLHEELSRANIGRTKSLPPAARKGIEWLDPLTWARELQKDEKSRALTEVAARLGIPLEKAHSAVHDAEAALRVLIAFLADERVPKNYGAFIQEQRRLGRGHMEERQYWRS